MVRLAVNRRAISCIVFLIVEAFFLSACDRQRDHYVGKRAVIKRPLEGGNVSKPRTLSNIEFIVIHFCSDAVRHPETPFKLDEIYHIYSRYGVSAHYFIDRDGQIYQAIQETLVAFHAGKGNVDGRPELRNRLNEVSIGIELLAVGSRDDMSIFMTEEVYARIPADCIGFTDAQYEALRELIDDLCRRHPSIKRDRRHILGHNEYAPDRRTDPGYLFQWSRLDLGESR